ncbi:MULTISPECIES: BA14K family protein [unclassified Mesorhizobium]|uniref:BA14K family protein n=1 Tax=unclassified Mesorhizobium TaxID=325217 RepID=UPI000FD79672|nr:MULTISPECIES: BA14K family protein [unclassified Mesorhizobium]TGQ48112.1 BA14K family protein [Mesorhizobium sp. M00.F.Ca.ET.216.01.1.1]TIS58948.1 MAG: BA14K family protein [Mesorhizobium sp.]TIS92275.1 MAG: BA14K family protein [Mesorhizobium sp.]TJW18176.1 MAG: BA14K family protein [Mesorhizobium sp.]TJW46117.1 MAG: BA14K family protein [Mesorhizobium sp.]
MNKVASGLLATVVSVSFAASEIVPVNAAPVYAPQGQVISSDVQTVDHRRWMRHRNFSRDDGMYWRGHRGYRHYRHGYRRHGDFWFPLAAFATGALITGAILNNQNRVYRGDAHVRWCYNHYRSYRAFDNTFQPNYGPRRQCISPY